MGALLRRGLRSSGNALEGAATMAATANHRLTASPSLPVSSRLSLCVPPASLSLYVCLIHSRVPPAPPPPPAPPAVTIVHALFIHVCLQYMSQRASLPLSRWRSIYARVGEERTCHNLGTCNIQLGEYINAAAYLEAQHAMSTDMSPGHMSLGHID